MLWRFFKKNTDAISVLIFFVLCLFICKSLKISCFIYKVTGVECPTCNMTRAIFALISGDIHTYIRLNVMAVPILIVFLGMLFFKDTGKYKCFFDIYAMTILIINFIYYANRLIN